MRLVLCGNGFDLHHGLKTGYWNYRDYLLSNSSRAVKDYEFLTKQLAGTSAWNDVEASLEINYSEYIENLINHCETASDMCIETYWEDELRFLFSFTGESFARWLSNIDFTIAKPDPSLCLSQSDLYVTFNYTDTLQRLYNIPENNVLSIHGKLKDIDSSAFGMGDVFPFGATIENVEGIDPIVHGDELANDIVHYSIQFGADAKKVAEMYASARRKYYKPGNPYFSLISRTDDIVSATTKDVRSNFDKLKWFFYGKPIDEVVIMGHSLSYPDIMYYSEVLIPYLKDSKWTVMRYVGKSGKSEDFEKKNEPLERMLGKKVNVVDW